MISGAVPNLIPLLTDGGAGLVQAARAASSLGIGSLCGMIAIGFLIDRMDARKMALITYLLPSAAMALLQWGAAMPAFYAAAFCVGATAGSQMGLISYLLTRYFPLRHFGGLLGVITALMSLVSGVAPVLTGYSFDIFGAYVVHVDGLWHVFSSPAP